MNTPLTIELISTFTCSRCVKAKKNMQQLIKGLNNKNINYREINVLEQIDYVVQLGVLKTPAIVINGELIFRSLPSKNQFYKTLEKYLN